MNRRKTARISPGQGSFSRSLDDSDLQRVGFLKSNLGAAGDNLCDLYFRMIDQQSGNYVMLRSKKPILVDRQLLNALREAEIKFMVNARV